jgi:heme-degrading monooxygenase HmoA
MIVRVVTARVKPGRAGALNDLLRQQLPILKSHEGLVYVKLARRMMADDGERVILFEEWADTRSLHGWVGPDLSVARLIDGAEAHLDEVTVEHYEALDIDPETLW